MDNLSWLILIREFLLVLPMQSVLITWSTFIFLAVEESKQSQGYGSQILAQVREEAGERPCVLTIEPMDEEQVSNRAQRLKRLAFYERNGYQALNHFYFEGSERYQILTTDKSLSLVDLERALAKTFLGRYGIRVD